MDHNELAHNLSELANLSRDVVSDSANTQSGQLGKYRIDETLGSGGQSVALLAWDTDLHRAVVLKVYYREEAPGNRQRVLSEGRALVRVSSPYVATCHTVETFAGRPCLVLEYIPGPNPGSGGVRYSHDEVGEILRKIGLGLQAIHENGLVHRDMKPQNIILQPDGNPRIIDFGFSSSNMRPGETAGTSAYLAPELARGESTGDTRSDIFGLGAIGFEMLTGQPPFTGDTREEVLRNAGTAKLSQAIPESGHPVSRMIAKCLEASPLRRFQSAAAAVAALEPSEQKTNWKSIALGSTFAAFALVLFAVVRSDDKPTDIHAAERSVYWVDSSPRGNTAIPDGLTPETAFFEIAAAINAADAWDVIRIRGYADGHDGPLFYTLGRHVLTSPQHEGIELRNWGAANPSKPPEQEHQRLPVLSGPYPWTEDSTDAHRARVKPGRSGFRIEANHVTIENIAIRGATGPAISIGPTAIQSVIRNCTLYRSRAQAILCEGASDLTVDECFIRLCGEHDSRAAVEVIDTVGVNIGQTTINNPGSETTSAGIALTNCGNAKVEFNWILQQTGHPAVLLESTSDTFVCQNLMYRCRTGLQVAPEGQCNVLYVHGNIVAECEQDGIRLEGPDLSVRTCFNTIRKCGGNGILVSAPITDLVIQNNALLDNARSSIAVSGVGKAKIDGNALRKGSTRIDDAIPVGSIIELPVDETGRLKPQLQIDEFADTNPAERDYYQPLPSSVLRDRGRLTSMRQDTLDAVGRPRRIGEILDIGAVEYLTAAEQQQYEEWRRTRDAEYNGTSQ